MRCTTQCVFAVLRQGEQYICQTHGDVHVCGKNCKHLAVEDDVFFCCPLSGVRVRRNAVEAFRNTIVKRHQATLNGQVKRKFSIKTLRQGPVQHRHKRARAAASGDRDDFSVTVQLVIFALLRDAMSALEDADVTDISMRLTQKTHHMWHALQGKSNRKIKLEAFVVGFFYLLRKDICHDKEVTIESMPLMKNLPKPEKLKTLGYSKTYLTTASKYIREAMMKMRDTDMEGLRALCRRVNFG